MGAVIFIFLIYYFVCFFLLTKLKAINEGNTKKRLWIVILWVFLLPVCLASIYLYAFLLAKNYGGEAAMGAVTLLYVWIMLFLPIGSIITCYWSVHPRRNIKILMWIFMPFLLFFIFKMMRIV
jgi:hypothetical protein